MLQVGNSVYYNYTLSVNGKREQHGTDYDKDYLTKLIVSTSLVVYIFTFLQLDFKKTSLSVERKHKVIIG